MPTNNKAGALRNLMATEKRGDGVVYTCTHGTFGSRKRFRKHLMREHLGYA